jgi:hypothetical protein
MSPTLSLQYVDRRDYQREPDEQRRKPGEASEFQRKQAVQDRSALRQCGSDDRDKIQLAAAEYGGSGHRRER